MKECLTDEDEEARHSTALMLRALGPEGEAALREALSDPDERVREAARYGLDAAIE